jgi:phage FluMu protein gp41
MKTTHSLIYPWTVDGFSFDTVTIRAATREDFVAANTAAIEQGAMSHDGKTFLPCPITHGKVLLRRCIVALDGKKAAVTDSMLDRLGVIDFEALVDSFTIDEGTSLRILREIIGAPDAPPPTRH